VKYSKKIGVKIKKELIQGTTSIALPRRKANWVTARAETAKNRAR